MSDRCRIIGVLDSGVDGITPAALRHIQNADLIIGAGRTLALFSAEYKQGGEPRDLSGKFAELPGWIDAVLQHGKEVVVLATGDPLCHGIARLLITKLGPERCEVLPNLSTIQLAFARLGLAWQEVKICSIHGRDTGEWRPGGGAGARALSVAAEHPPPPAVGDLYQSREYSGPDRPDANQ